MSIILRTRFDAIRNISGQTFSESKAQVRIQIEAFQGWINQRKLRNLLQGVAKLQFWEVAEANEISCALRDHQLPLGCCQYWRIQKYRLIQ